MSCGFDREIIQRYADNTIEPLEYIFLKEHINYCFDCRKELDLMMSLENGLDKFFNYDSGAEDLDQLISGLVDGCMYELNKREKLKYTLNKGIKLGNGIIDNSLKFVEYIPGSKRMGKGVKKTASITVRLVKALAKKEIGKLLTGLR